MPVGSRGRGGLALAASAVWLPWGVKGGLGAPAFVGCVAGGGSRVWAGGWCGVLPVWASALWRECRCDVGGMPSVPGEWRVGSLLGWCGCRCRWGPVGGGGALAVAVSVVRPSWGAWGGLADAGVAGLGGLGFAGCVAGGGSLAWAGGPQLAGGVVSGWCGRLHWGAVSARAVVGRVPWAPGEGYALCVGGVGACAGGAPGGGTPAVAVSLV